MSQSKRDRERERASEGLSKIKWQKPSHYWKKTTRRTGKILRILILYIPCCDFSSKNLEEMEEEGRAATLRTTAAAAVVTELRRKKSGRRSIEEDVI